MEAIETNPVNQNKSAIPQLFSISILFSEGMLIFISGIAALPLTISLILNPGDFVDEIRRLPQMVFVMVTGSAFLVFAFIQNYKLSKGKDTIRSLKITYGVLIIYLWVIIISSIYLMNDYVMPLSLNIFFIPFYLQLLLMHYNQKTVEYLDLVQSL